jgi:predicted CopG family antitoxin
MKIYEIIQLFAKSLGYKFVFDFIFIKHNQELYNLSLDTDIYIEIKKLKSFTKYSFSMTDITGRLVPYRKELLALAKYFNITTVSTDELYFKVYKNKIEVWSFYWGNAGKYNDLLVSFPI